MSIDGRGRLGSRARRDGSWRARGGRARTRGPPLVTRRRLRLRLLGRSDPRGRTDGNSAAGALVESHGLGPERQPSFEPEPEPGVGLGVGLVVGVGAADSLGALSPTTSRTDDPFPAAPTQVPTTHAAPTHASLLTPLPPMGNSSPTTSTTTTTTAAAAAAVAARLTGSSG